MPPGPNGPDHAATAAKPWRTPGPTDLVFPKWQRELFKTILEEEGLRFDREGAPRTAYSLRHTYIRLRLMEGADIYQIAKNCRTSVEMIEKYYAAPINTRLDAAAINVMRPKKKTNRADRRLIRVSSNQLMDPCFAALWVRAMCASIDCDPEQMGGDLRLLPLGFAESGGWRSPHSRASTV